MSSKFLKIFPLITLTIAVILHGINFISPLPADYLVFGHLLLILGMVTYALRSGAEGCW